MFASVSQASVRIIDSLTWSLFTSLLTHVLVLLCVDAHCFIFWNPPGDVLAAPESALCGWTGVTPLSRSLSLILECLVDNAHMWEPPSNQPGWLKQM